MWSSLAQTLTLPQHLGRDVRDVAVPEPRRNVERVVVVVEPDLGALRWRRVLDGVDLMQVFDERRARPNVLAHDAVDHGHDVDAGDLDALRFARTPSRLLRLRDRRHGELRARRRVGRTLTMIPRVALKYFLVFRRLAGASSTYTTAKKDFAAQRFASLMKGACAAAMRAVRRNRARSRAERARAPPGGA